MFEINTIYRALPDTPSIIEGYVRLVGISPERKVYLMRLDTPPFKLPLAMDLDDLANAIDARQVEIVRSFDIGLPQSLEALPDRALEKLEVHKKLMEPLVFNETLIFSESDRNRAFLDRGAETKDKPYHASVSTIRKLYLRRLASGGSDLAYAPRYDLRGGVGKEQRKRTARKGPKAKNPKGESKVKLPDVRDTLKEGLDLYYFSGKYTLKDSFNLTLKRSFVDHAKLDQIKGQGRTYELKEVLLPDSKLPTERQFRYLKDELERKEGKTRTRKPRQSRQPEKERIYTGSARAGVLGPGYRFEIDASKYQAKIVSKYDRSRVLKPATLYLIIDVWSGAITGYVLSLENESWALAVQALRNCFEDKQKTFDRLNLPYKSCSDWSCCELSARLTADRGALVSDKAGPCVETGGHIEITEAWRGDRKGTIEGAIKRLKFVKDYHVPGEYPKNPGRGEPKGTASAALTLEELERAVVKTIVHLNSMPVPEKNIPMDMEVDGSVPLTYMGLYEWGLRNRPGHTRTLSPRDVFFHLMTKGKASVTDNGLCFKGQLFNCKSLEQHGYLAKAKRNGSYKIEIRYYEYSADFIWYFDDSIGDWHPAENQNVDVRRLKEAFFELEHRHQSIEYERKAAHREYSHIKDEDARDTTAMFNNAKGEAKKAKEGRSKTELNKNINENHKTERNANRLKSTHEEVSSYMSGLDHEQDKSATEKQRKSAQAEKKDKPAKTRAIDRWRKRFGENN